MEVRPRRAQAPAAVDVPVERGEPLLAVAVDVVGKSEPRLLDGGEERPKQRVGYRPALEHKGAAPPTEVIATGEAGLHPLEVGQAMGIIPCAHAGVSGPALIVERVAPLEDHAVDRARPTEDLAPGMVDPPPVHVRLRLRLVLPVIEAAPDGERERSRHVDENVEGVIRAAGL
jgi:hypothetical protein